MLNLLLNIILKSNPFSTKIADTAGQSIIKNANSAKNNELSPLIENK